MVHREGHRRPPRGQSRRTRMPAHDTLSDLQDFRVCSKGQVLGLSDPDAGPEVHRPPAEASAVVAWHGEAAALEAAKKQHMRRSIRHPCGETNHSSQTTRTEEQRRRSQRKRGKFRPRRVFMRLARLVLRPCTAVPATTKWVVQGPAA